MLTFKAITEMRKRKGRFGPLFTATAIDSTGKLLSVTTSSENIQAKWETDRFYVVKTYKLNSKNDESTITLTGETKDVKAIAVNSRQPSNFSTTSTSKKHMVIIP